MNKCWHTETLQARKKMTHVTMKYEGSSSWKCNIKDVRGRYFYLVADGVKTNVMMMDVP